MYNTVMRKKAVKIKHIKRREKKFDKKVSFKVLLNFLASCSITALSAHPHDLLSTSVQFSECVLSCVVFSFLTTDESSAE